MVKKLMAAIAIIGVLFITVVPFATPVSAAPANIVLSPNLFQKLDPIVYPIYPYTFPVTFTGTGLVNPSTVTFPDPNISAGVPHNYGGPDTSFICDITVAAAITTGPKEFSVSNSGGSITVYNGFSVSAFPNPPGASNSFIGFSMQPFRDSAGTIPVITSVSENDTIYYKFILSVTSSTGFNFYGGQISVQFPDGVGSHRVAGFGALTPLWPQIPEVKFGSPFSVMCPEPYIVHIADRQATGFLLAKGAYGNASFVTQLPGLQESSLFPGTIAQAYLEYAVAPVPELPAGLLFGIGLLGIGGFVMFKRSRRMACTRL